MLKNKPATITAPSKLNVSHKQFSYQDILAGQNVRMERVEHLRYLAYKKAYDFRQDNENNPRGDPNYKNNVASLTYLGINSQKPITIVASSTGDRWHSEQELIVKFLDQNKARFTNNLKIEIEAMIRMRDYKDKKVAMRNILEDNQVKNLIQNTPMAVFSERDTCIQEVSSDCFNLMNTVLTENHHHFYYSQDFYKLDNKGEYIRKKKEDPIEEKEGVIENRVIPSEATQLKIKSDLEATALRLNEIQLRLEIAKLQERNHELEVMNQHLESQNQELDAEVNLLIRNANRFDAIAEDNYPTLWTELRPTTIELDQRHSTKEHTNALAEDNLLQNIQITASHSEPIIEISDNDNNQIIAYQAIPPIEDDPKEYHYVTITYPESDLELQKTLDNVMRGNKGMESKACMKNTVLPDQSEEHQGKPIERVGFTNEKAARELIEKLERGIKFCAERKASPASNPNQEAKKQEITTIKRKRKITIKTPLLQIASQSVPPPEKNPEDTKIHVNQNTNSPKL
jgi:hypothetical protein